MRSGETNLVHRFLVRKADTRDAQCHMRLLARRAATPRAVHAVVSRQLKTRASPSAVVFLSRRRVLPVRFAGTTPRRRMGGSWSFVSSPSFGSSLGWLRRLQDQTSCFRIPRLHS